MQDPGTVIRDPSRRAPAPCTTSRAALAPLAATLAATLATTLAAALVVGGCASAPPDAQSAAPPSRAAAGPLAAGAGHRDRDRDLAQLRRVHDEWVEAYVAGDLARLERFYLPETKLMPDNNYLFTGWAEIREFFRAGHERFTYEARADLQQLAVEGDLGTAVGTVDVTMTPKAGGEPIVRALRYLIVFRRVQGDDWRIWLDMDQRFRPGRPGS